MRQIRSPNRAGFFSDASSRNRDGIGRIVAGATIVITDVYDQPLGAIHHRLRAYWEGEPGDADSALES